MGSLFSTNVSSVKTRFLVSLVANVGRAGISFFTVILIARGLSPVRYGDLFFLLGSFTAIRALMDMGTSQAFYTFISQRSRGSTFYVVYFSWITLQFFVTALVIAVILPSSMIDSIWLGQARNVILLAFFASFMQQQVWNTISQVCEASRLTVMVQMVGLGVVLTHFLIVLALINADFLSINAIFITIMSEYLVACIAIWWIMKNRSIKNNLVSQVEEASLKEIFVEYWIFCRPLIVIAIFSFFYEFLDRWMLQRFGGSEQQGFYQVAAQFAAVSLIATTSILRIFWKEIAEANQLGDHPRVARLYLKANKGLLMLGAIVSCFLVPWSEQLTLLLLGKPYVAAWPVLALMFLYPIHQSMGQINATMFMACERTGPYMKLTILGMLVSFPVTYFLLASPDEWLIPGLELGALGLAIKMLMMNVLFVNIQSWVLARFHSWDYEWSYQIVGVLFLLALGFLTKAISTIAIGIYPLMEMDKFSMLLMIFSGGILYMTGVFAFLWFQPSVFGVDQDEVKNMITVVVNRFKIANSS
jgi:O-antigen/teichoic acid export membrane protein